MTIEESYRQALAYLEELKTFAGCNLTDEDYNERFARAKYLIKYTYEILSNSSPYLNAVCPAMREMYKLTRQRKATTAQVKGFVINEAPSIVKEINKLL